MAQKNQKKSPQAHVPTGPVRCTYEEGCGAKIYRLHFCRDHFMWFKEGLITRQGHKARDFDKKYQAYLRRQSKAA